MRWWLLKNILCEYSTASVPQKLVWVCVSPSWLYWWLDCGACKLFVCHFGIYHRLLLVVAVSTEVCRGGVQLVFGGFLIDRYYHKHQHPWNIGSLARPKGTHVRVPIYELMGICVRGSAWIDGHQRRRGTDICHERPAEMHKHKKKLLQLKTPPWD